MNANTSIVETDKGVFLYLRTLKAGTDWWRREIETIEQMQYALVGELLPPDAKIAQMEKEGKGDLRRLADFSKRTIRKRLDKRMG